MSAPVGKWVKQEGKYESGENYVLGKVTVGSASYNGLRSRGDPKTHRAYVVLPGIHLKEGTDTFATIEEAKTRVESAVATWFEWVLS